VRILVLSCAEDEFAEAVDYSNEQLPGLGFEFAGEYNALSSGSDAIQKFGWCFHAAAGDASPTNEMCG
jgi:hypothetical protein